jgi:hypothetical protein
VTEVQWARRVGADELHHGALRVALEGRAEAIALAENPRESGSVRIGGIANRAEGKVELNNVTIAGNSAGSGGDAQGGGIANAATATVIVANSILAANSAANGTDCAGVLTSKGYNLIQNAAGCTISGDPAGNVVAQDAQLAVLAQNDGPTRTQALRAGSPAVDAGNPAKPTGSDGACARADQRGVARDQVGRCDIGAFEQGGKQAR